MFYGVYTALVTPFQSSGAVDYGKLHALVEQQEAAGIDGVVPVGTTGESPTLDYDEHKKVIETCVQAAAGRIKVIAGTGSNATAEAIELTTFARDVGADATLQVTPYYNRPSQEGLYRHFSTIADLGLPVVLYNVPSRCSTEIAVDTVVRLAAHPKITTIKEAGGNVPRVSQILSQCPITVLSGDDAMTLPMMVVGARGVISVASNVAPKFVADMVHAAMSGRWDDAAGLHRRLFPLFTDLFLETNPLPVKAAMAMQGLIEETYRLPLCEPSEKTRVRLAACLKDLNKP